MADDYAGRTAQLANSPLQHRFITNYMSSGLPAYGTLLGTTHFNPAIAPAVPAGAPRPLTPGEYVQNPNDRWSSEISTTVPHPTKPGKWTNVPSVWLVNGVPKRLTDDQSIAAARQSGLDWPEFPTADVADRSAGAREEDWQRVGPEGASQVPPLWNRR
jgi:hypothetical protein